MPLRGLPPPPELLLGVRANAIVQAADAQLKVPCADASAIGKLGWLSRLLQRRGREGLLPADRLRGSARESKAAARLRTRPTPHGLGGTLTEPVDTDEWASPSTCSSLDDDGGDGSGHAAGLVLN
jgi:hypothetical protein